MEQSRTWLCPWSSSPAGARTHWGLPKASEGLITARTNYCGQCAFRSYQIQARRLCCRAMACGSWKRGSGCCINSPMAHSFPSFIIITALCTGIAQLICSLPFHTVQKCSGTCRLHCLPVPHNSFRLINTQLHLVFYFFPPS